jgi:hypothetical protein
VDIALYCNQTVEVDGLMIDNPDIGARNVYMVQKVRVAGGDWAKENPETKGKGPWFRRDPRIKAMIAEKGYLGRGLDVDGAFIKDWF